MKVLLVNDSTSNPNWGDRAAAISLRGMIEQCGAEIVASISEDELRHGTLFKGPRQPAEPERRRTAKELAKLFLPPIALKVRSRLFAADRSLDDPLVPQRLEDFREYANRILDDATFLELRRMVEMSEVLVVHGDGCMMGNGRIPRTELFLSYLARRQFGKRVIIVNHTADFGHPQLREIAEAVYPELDDVVFRDVISVEKCRYMCDGRYAADTAFLFEPAERERWAELVQRSTYFDVWPDSARFDPTRPYLCVGGSSAFSYDGEPGELIEQYVSLIEGLLASYRGQVVLTVSDSVDQPVFRPIASRLRLPLVGLTTSVQQAVDILGNADAYLGGRWHPSIFAMRGGTPVVPVASNTFKMSALMDMAGLSPTTFDVGALQASRKAICARLLEYVEQGEALRSKLRDWARDQARGSWGNVRFLREGAGTPDVGTS